MKIICVAFICMLTVNETCEPLPTVKQPVVDEPDASVFAKLSFSVTDTVFHEPSGTGTLIVCVPSPEGWTGNVVVNVAAPMHELTAKLRVLPTVGFTYCARRFAADDLFDEVMTAVRKFFG